MAVSFKNWNRNLFLNLNFFKNVKARVYDAVASTRCLAAGNVRRYSGSRCSSVCSAQSTWTPQSGVLQRILRRWLHCIGSRRAVWVECANVYWVASLCYDCFVVSVMSFVPLIVKISAVPVCLVTTHSEMWLSVVICDYFGKCLKSRSMVSAVTHRTPICSTSWSLSSTILNSRG